MNINIRTDFCSFFVDQEVVSCSFVSTQTGKTFFKSSREEVYSLKTWQSLLRIHHWCRSVSDLSPSASCGYLFQFSVWFHYSRWRFSCCDGEFLNHVCWIPLKTTFRTVLLCSYWPFSEGFSTYAWPVIGLNRPVTEGRWAADALHTAKLFLYATDCIFSKTFFDFKVSSCEISGAVGI